MNITLIALLAVIVTLTLSFVGVFTGTFKYWIKWFTRSILILFVSLFFIGSEDTKPVKNVEVNTTETVKVNKTLVEKHTIGDNNKYTVCYGVMTQVHKKTGLHKNNRQGSIIAKERVCSAYSRGEINSYPGK